MYVFSKYNSVEHQKYYPCCYEIPLSEYTDEIYRSYNERDRLNFERWSNSEFIFGMIGLTETNYLFKMYPKYAEKFICVDSFKCIKHEEK